MEWIYVQTGSATVQVDGAYEQLHRGELAFVNAGQLHGAVKQTPDTVLVCIVFNEALVRGSGLDVTEFQYFVPYLRRQRSWPSWMRASAPNIEEMNAAYARLLLEFERKRPGYELLVKAELLRIFGLYFRYAEEQVKLTAVPGTNRQTHDFSALLRMLRERYREPIPIEEAARTVSLSPNHFCKIFKRVTGKTFVEYVHLLRVQEAERLLRDTDLTVTEIAGNVGFSNLTYFGRVFRKVRNRAPTDVRSGRAGGGKS